MSLAVAIHRFIQPAMRPFAAAFILGALLAAGCADSQTADPKPGTRINAVATVGMLADTVEAVGGDRVTVERLMGPGIDPHLYKPTRRDIIAIQDADLVFSVGLHLEGQMGEVLARDTGTTHVAVGDLMTFNPRHTDKGPEHTDPHIWMDPRLWSEATTVVRDRLIAIDPDGEAHYTAAAQAHLDELSKLDAYAEQVLSTVPERSRVLVTAHDAFGYFGARYGFEVEAIQGLSTQSEAGLLDIVRIVGLIVDRKIAAVFVESTVSESNITAIISGAAARGHTVTIGGELFSDAMGAPGTYEGTYLGMIDHNVTTIARALGGEAPATGRLGRLSQ